MTGPDKPAVKLEPLEVDVAVVGSGAAGLSAALRLAAEKNLKVAVFEKHSQLGGTSAWSSGWMWIPGSGAQPAKGAKGGKSAKSANSGDPADALAYLEAELGPEVFKAQRAKVDAYLASGPDMLDFLSGRFPNAMVFEPDTDTPDFHASEGQHLGGRMVRAQAIDGRRLAGQLKRLRRPPPEFTLAGMAIEAGADLNAFLQATRSLRAAGHVASRLAGHLRDVVTTCRGMRLVNGNALVARMMVCASILELDAQQERIKAKRPRAAHDDFERLRLFTDHAVVALTRSGKAVDGLVVDTPNGLREVHATRGVILACGGFPHDMARIDELFPPELAFGGHRSVAPEQNTGDGLRLAEKVGGRVVATVDPKCAAAFVPVSVRRRRDGSKAVYPHFVERAKPGFIAVQRDGQRFCDEAGSYFDFVQDWLGRAPPGEHPQAWMVCDLRALFLYGLGMAKPGNPLPLGALISGYLKAGWTIEALARRCRIDAAALRKQVALYNAGAPDEDSQFHRGVSDYDRSQGDSLTRPNPCVGRISLAPYFAVQLKPGSLGTLAGLHTDEHARVLDASNRPIPGLYAAGNDMAAVMGGRYPTNGVTLASAMIFGYRAACDILASAPVPAPVPAAGPAKPPVPARPRPRAKTPAAAARKPQKATPRRRGGRTA